MTKIISAKETEVKVAVETTNKQLAEVNAKLEALQLGRQEEGETTGDRASAISQVAAEQTALDASRKLLQELLSGVQAAATNAPLAQSGPRNTFGSQGKGFQIATNYGGISGISFS